jgi:hypothetical protein
MCQVRIMSVNVSKNLNSSPYSFGTTLIIAVLQLHSHCLFIGMSYLVSVSI